MARKPSPERLAELQKYLGFFRAMWAFQEKLNPEIRSHSALPAGTSYGDHAAAQVQEAVTSGAAPFSEILTGVKQGVADQLEMTRDLPRDVVKHADEFLVAAGALSLTEMRRHVWRVIPKVLERGRIRTLDEFYVVKNVLDDDGEDLSDDERARLGTLRFEFETRAAPARRTSSATEARRAGRRQATAERPRQSARVPSPSGWCEAYVVEWSEDNRQVMLEFDGGACGSGAVSAFGPAPRLELRWLDATTLEVQHASETRVERGAGSGEVIQCGGAHRRVRVVLKPV